MVDSSDFRFIQRDPNIPAKNPSLPKEQWEELKPMILDLLGKAVSIADILRQLELRHIHVTRSQLNTQMKKWGLNKDNVQLRPDATVLPQPTDQEHARTQAPSPDTDVLLTDNQVPVDSALTDFEASTLKQMESLELGMDSIDIPEDTEVPRFLCGCSGNPLGEPVPDTVVDAPMAGEVGRSMPAYPPSTTLSPGITSAGKIQASGLKYEGINFPSLEMPSYEVTGTNLDLQQRLRVISLSTPEGCSFLDRLNHMASLLFTMRSYAKAFEIFFISTSALNDVMGMYVWTSRYFLFSAMSCVRSAWTLDQKTASQLLVKRLQGWMEKIQRHDDCDFVRYVRSVLESRVYREETDTLAETAYWTAGSSLSWIWHGMPPTDFQTIMNSPSTALEYFYVSAAVRRTMLHALSIIEDLLPQPEFKYFLSSAWFQDHGDNRWIDLVQVHIISTLTLKYSARWSLETSHMLRLLQPSRGNPDSDDRLLGQAVLTLTFVLLSRARHQFHVVEASPGSYTGSVDSLKLELLRLKKDLNANPGSRNYKQFIDEYLRAGSERDKTRFLDDFDSWTFDICAATMAGASLNRKPPLESLVRRDEQTINPSVMDTGLFALSLDPPHQELESSLSRDSSQGPTLARSLGSSSRSFARFRSAARYSLASPSQHSIRTTSTGMPSDRMSWRFSVVTGMPSDSSL
ncbi:hypothetical protein AYL99_07094 [Fonsecaea erecta]|uniref:Clr5 domain-containing protein n=1 Tax=Fonsecaea erecta TaxID=1367422 RepID=A0A178ZDX0_9EURO|nr:hypothetical protein AYL99_07094 [Fonsecaea erecta]OAP58004.1 hypothetical protein AYL99_07094 [Fonsecaea erecta]